MSPHPPATPAERERIVALRKAGLTLPEIAAECHRHRDTVRNILRQEGVAAPAILKPKKLVKKLELWRNQFRGLYGHDHQPRPVTLPRVSIQQETDAEAEASSLAQV